MTTAKKAAEAQAPDVPDNTSPAAADDPSQPFVGGHYGVFIHADHDGERQAASPADAVELRFTGWQQTQEATAADAPPLVYELVDAPTKK